jgi:hypothetical protein
MDQQVLSYYEQEVMYPRKASGRLIEAAGLSWAADWMSILSDPKADLASLEPLFAAVSRSAGPLRGIRDVMSSRKAFDRHKAKYRHTFRDIINFAIMTRRLDDVCHIFL